MGSAGSALAPMAKSKLTKPQRRRGEKRARSASAGPQEPRTAEAATVAWTVTVTMVVVCDLAAIAANVYLLRNPDAKGAQAFGGLMLFGGAVVGVASLALMPVVYRLRKTPPPTGFAVFAACAAAAPILAVIARSFQ
jgi:hypothetical protein